MSFLALAFAAAVQLATPTPAPARDRSISIAQVAGVSAETLATNRAVDRLERAEAQQRGLAVEKQRLRARYNTQLTEVDRLKRARASWRRDRQLSEQKAQSQKTARELAAIDHRLRAQSAIIARERKAALRAATSEMGRRPTSARTAYLRNMIPRLQPPARSKPTKILLPDLRIDEMADPEELVEQLALLGKAERELAREEQALSERARRYERMVALRDQRQRADEGIFDEDQVRRTTGRIDRGASGAPGDDADFGGAAADADPNSSPPSAQDFESGGDFAKSSVVLADVVDTGTRDALRKADKSSDPSIRATVAKRAQQQVSERLLRVRASKARLTNHLKRLQR